MAEVTLDLRDVPQERAYAQRYRFFATFDAEDAASLERMLRWFAGDGR